MSFTDKNQKSDEAFSVDRQSQSSGSRRVMWKLSDDEENFDSIVNYRRVPARNTGAIPKTVSPAEGGTVAAGTTADRSMSANSNKKTGVDAWTHVFNLIKYNKLAKEITSPNLALRYKPSKESLKYKRSKEKQDDCKENICLDSKILVTDLKVETCCLPPQQSALVHEPAPKFAQRIPTNETDSSEVDIPKTAVCGGATKINAPTSPRGSRCMKLEITNNMKITPSPESSFETMETAANGTAAMGTSKAFPKNRKQSANANNASPKRSVNSCTNGNHNASSGGVASAVTATFRQRQMELHRCRLQVEQRRLELVDLKIAREREEALRSQILFQKDLEFKSSQLKHISDDLSSI